ncbi:unnamed protein product [Symbiodinium natans]|uniref:Uncharacterized protein n=1 Tax=Symbiodinium natans TaxID=878477 RepID=A0A812Q8L4_9DINO|nr:unnamed protein product [Symbiodinium natans]
MKTCKFTAPATRTAARPPEVGDELRDFLNAPFRLNVESYEDFAKLLPSLGQEASSRASVEEELRRLNIDPKIFYKNQRPLRASQFVPEDFGFEPEPDDPDGPLPAVFQPPARSSEASASAPAAEINAVTPATSAREPEYDEIALETQAETCGGRLGHETPEGLGSKLQIDSLTEDGDEPDFRKELLKEGEEEDAVEAFSLDPDFDYDNPPEGMSSKIDPRDLREVMRVSPPPPRESNVEEDVAEDAVHEP